MESTQKCAICWAPNTETHLGINACRACAIFYRRTEAKGITYICRERNESCPLDRKSQPTMCKKCRHNRVKSILSNNTPSQFASVSTATPYTFQANPQPSTLQREELAPLRTDGIILNRIRNAYNEMCNMRQEKELEGIIYDKNTFLAVPIRFQEMKKTAKALYDSVFSFAASSFPEFEKISAENQQTLLINFCKTFREFDAGFRSLKYFKSCDKLFFGITKYIDFNDLDLFVADSPHREIMKTAYVRDHSGSIQTMYDWFPVMERAQFSPEEFVAGVGILFWNIEGKSVADELTVMASQQRKAILSELHNFYRNEIGMADYSGRIGELFMLISTIERCLRSKFHIFEMFKLMDIFDDETLQLAKMQLD